jgi:hypothetical protein
MLLLYKNAIRTSQETHNVSATEPNLLMFRGKPRCFLWGKVTLRLTVGQSECLGIDHPSGTCDQILLPVGFLLYKNAIRTSQERHYVTATEPNLLMLSKEKPAVPCEVRLLHDWRSVRQNALVSTTVVRLATRYYFLSECCYLKFEVLFLWGALSDERTGLQFTV